MSLRIVFAGGGAFCSPALRALANWDKCDLTGLITVPPRPAHRGMKMHPSPAAKVATELGIDSVVPANDAQIAEHMKRSNAQFLVVCAYGRKLGAESLQSPTKACLNIHASLLPRWRGAAPIERAILAGDEQTGVTIIGMNEKIDAGEIYLMRDTKIGYDETAGQLRGRLAEIGSELLIEALSNFDALTPSPQPSTGITRASKLSKKEAKIEWGKPAEDILRAVRAFNPTPGAYTESSGQRVKILRAKAVPEQGRPGKVLSQPGNVKLVVACGSDAIEILEVVPAGSHSMHAADFLRGHGPIDNLGN